MPKLTGGDVYKIARERLAASLDPQEGLGSPLVARQALESRIAQERAAGRALIANDSLIQWQKGAVIGASGLMTRLGVPVEVYKNFYAAIQMPLSELVEPGWGKDLPLAPTVSRLLDNGRVQDFVNEILDVGLEVAGNVAAAVPIIGWVISIGIKVGQAVDSALGAANRYPKLYERTAFNPASDEAVYRNFCATAVNSGDWTEVFLPPGTSNPLGALSGFGFVPTDDGGAEIVPREPMGGGVIPGSGNMHAGIGIGGNNVWELAEFFPLVGQQGPWMWSGFVNPFTGGQVLPSMFSVDTRRLGWWMGYLEHFRKYLEGGYQDVLTAGIEYGRGSAGKNECRKLYGKNRCDKKDGVWHGFPIKGSDVERIIDFYANPAWFGWADSKGRVWRKARKNAGPWTQRSEKTGWAFTETDSNDPHGIETAIPVIEVKRLRDRQFAALNTIGVAYLEQDLPAFEADQEMLKRFGERRNQLLSHPARCGVVLDEVPTDWDGGIYKEALIRSGVGGPGCQGASLDIAAAVPRETDPADIPTGLDEHFVSAGRRKVSSGSGGVGIALLGAAAVYMMSKKGR